MCTIFLNRRFGATDKPEYSQLPMRILDGKKIILCVSGSIAAYKAAFLTRLLVKKGAAVQVLMTPHATRFVSPLTFSTLSTRPVYIDVVGEDEWNNHVALGLWADAMVIAPATASTLAKLAQGLSDNLVVATYLSARCPVFIAPAMDVDMWHHPATRENLERLLRYGNQLIPVGNGPLASGLSGEGRLAEPEEIAAQLEHFFSRQGKLAGQRWLITAGPTYEPMDPVRFIGNRSSGKMGMAIAEAAAAEGADVVLVLGPSVLSSTHPNIQIIRVETAVEMHRAAVEQFDQAQVTVLTAAVADYRPEYTASQKIKKTADTRILGLVPNPDIAADLGKRKAAGQLVIGFALETDNEYINALDKLQRKNFDLIVLNSLRDPGAGFSVDTNKVTIFFANNKRWDLELKTKTDLAADLLEAIEEYRTFADTTNLD